MKKGIIVFSQEFFWTNKNKLRKWFLWCKLLFLIASPVVSLTCSFGTLMNNKLQIISIKQYISICLLRSCLLPLFLQYKSTILKWIQGRLPLFLWSHKKQNFETSVATKLNSKFNCLFKKYLLQFIFKYQFNKSNKATKTYSNCFPQFHTGNIKNGNCCLLFWKRP